MQKNLKILDKEYNSNDQNHICWGLEIQRSFSIYKKFLLDRRSFLFENINNTLIVPYTKFEGSTSIKKKYNWSI